MTSSSDLNKTKKLKLNPLMQSTTSRTSLNTSTATSSSSATSTEMLITQLAAAAMREKAVKKR